MIYYIHYVYDQMKTNIYKKGQEKVIQKKFKTPAAAFKGFCVQIPCANKWKQVYEKVNWQATRIIRA